jgi:hypothetical protein
MYRKAMEKSEYRLLPEVLARMSIPQQMLVFQRVRPGGGDETGQGTGEPNEGRERA